MSITIPNEILREKRCCDEKICAFVQYKLTGFQKTFQITLQKS